MNATATVSAAALARAFRSTALFEALRSNAMDAAIILANAELPAAAAVLAPRARKHMAGLAGINAKLADPHTSEATVRVLDGTRRVQETLLKEAQNCLLTVALGSMSRMEGISPADREALCAIILARVE